MLIHKYENPIFVLIILFMVISCNEKDDRQNELLDKKKTEEIKYTSKINWIGHWLGEDKREELVREIGNEFEFRNQEIQVSLMIRIGVRNIWLIYQLSRIICS